MIATIDKFILSLIIVKDSYRQFSYGNVSPKYLDRYRSESNYVGPNKIII